MGYLTEDLSGKEGQIEAINQYGNQDALQNKKMNYLFVIETSNSINTENKLFQRKLGVTGQAEISLEICPYQDNKLCLFEKFFNAEDQGSIAAQYKEVYGEDHKDSLYYYSTEFEHESLVS